MRIEIIDIVIAVLILYSIFRGYHLGLIRQIGALGGILLAILGANLLSPFMGLLLNKTELFPEYVNHKIAYLVTFLIILFSCKFITRLMQRFARMLHLGLPDKWAGVLFCGFKYILVISAVLNIYDALYHYSDKIRHIETAHEQGAAHAADGSSSASDNRSFLSMVESIVNRDDFPFCHIPNISFRFASRNGF